MSYVETFAVCCRNHKESVNTVCGEIFLMLHLEVRKATTELWKVNSLSQKLLAATEENCKF